MFEPPGFYPAEIQSDFCTWLWDTAVINISKLTVEAINRTLKRHIIASGAH